MKDLTKLTSVGSWFFATAVLLGITALWLPGCVWLPVLFAWLGLCLTLRGLQQQPKLRPCKIRSEIPPRSARRNNDAP